MMKTIRPETARLAICCNDHRNGAFKGYFDDVRLWLPCGECVELQGPSVSVAHGDGKFLRIGRLKISNWGYAEWVGNWCWDEVCLGIGSMLRVLNYLKLRGWDCHCAPSRIFDRWKLSRPITENEFKEWLIVVDLEGKSQ